MLGVTAPTRHTEHPPLRPYLERVRTRMTEDIETFLGTVAEATAKAVATGIGLPHFDVVRAINKMHAAGQVEREKRAGGGNEYVYWLSRSAPVAQQATDAAPTPPAAPVQSHAAASASLPAAAVGARAPLFVTVGRNCKPQRHESLDKAQRRGRALVRSEKETEVLVLEPVGRIVRGTEWMPR
ncbi:1-pyrroline-5-carboxylate dehydrogenase [Burkholderia vietnamiensis]|uniref:1-pyrroline-5-carboxylate dehydrogenase n=1 Tax=Burkholderia vietnamiensis TaxID=60552 RepID=UPI00402AB693